MLFVWVIIILVVALGYVYWPNVQNSKFYASIVPGSPVLNENGEMEFIKAENGHFFIDAEVNGKLVHFMVDTGASDISLNQSDAKKLGIDVNALNYNKLYSTANGMTRGASVKISYLKVGSFELHDLYVSVNEGKLDGSLLGMQFLDKFKSYRVEGNKLVLRP